MGLGLALVLQVVRSRPHTRYEIRWCDAGLAKYAPHKISRVGIEMASPPCLCRGVVPCGDEGGQRGSLCTFYYRITMLSQPPASVKPTYDDQTQRDIAQVLPKAAFNAKLCLPLPLLLTPVAAAFAATAGCCWLDCVRIWLILLWLLLCSCCKQTALLGRPSWRSHRHCRHCFQAPTL